MMIMIMKQINKGCATHYSKSICEITVQIRGPLVTSVPFQRRENKWNLFYLNSTNNSKKSP
jgi:hypothetical protein